MTHINIRKVSTKKERETCLHIRTIVFVNEQNVPLHEEMDGLDEDATHYLLFVDGEASATARMRILDQTAKIERVAVLKNHRGLSLGNQLMKFIIADILKYPAIKTMKLGAQIQVLNFYEKLGFKSYGDEYLDANIKHIWMQRQT